MDNEVSKIIELYNDGEINALNAYIEIKKIEKEITSCIKESLSLLQGSEEFQIKFQEVENEGGRYGDFILSSSIRKTYNFEEYKPYFDKKSELKDIEKTLKFVVDKAEKGETVNDKEGNIINPISVKYTTIYTVKGKKS